MKSTQKANQEVGTGNMLSKFFKLRITRIILLMNPPVSKEKNPFPDDVVVSLVCEFFNALLGKEVNFVATLLFS